jgi:hypothetical protein
MSDGFDISELTKFEKKLVTKVNDTMPKESRKFIKKEGSKLSNKNKSTFKSKGIGEETGSLLKGFKAGKAYKYDSNWSCRAYNNAPHAHLLNEGHLMVGHKPEKKALTLNYGGTFVPGYHFMEEAAKLFESSYYSDVEQFLEDIFIKGL